MHCPRRARRNSSPRGGSHAALQVIAIAALALTAAIATTRAQDAQRTVWDGVYTDAQAERGKALYMEKCVQCHGPELMGGGAGAGPLQGATFSGNWNGVPLGDMLERVRQSMPLDKPATLSRQQCADVLAFIFSVNKFPAGKAELSRQAEILNTIVFKATRQVPPL
jgi:quinoprotein glucose dehydrogenase